MTDEQKHEQTALFANVFSVIIYVTCMIFFFWASFFLPKEKKDLTHIAEIKTAMISICTWVVAYHFGSYAGAQRKDAIIKDMTASNKNLTDTSAKVPVISEEKTLP